MNELNVNELHVVQLSVLDHFSNLCKKINVTYMLAYGTLLGAVRHKGFIPWDDDVDVWMPRADYERFCEYCVNNKEQILPYKLADMRTDNDYPYNISRFCDSRYIIEATGNLKDETGIFIDIYPLDLLGSNYKQSKAFVRRAFILSRITINAKSNHWPKSMSFFKGILNFFVYPSSRIIGKRKLHILLTKYVSKHANDAEATYIGCPIISTYGYKEIYKREWFDNTIELEFENNLFYAPIQYHDILKQIYGDYMVLPPEEKRDVNRHKYKAYRTDEKKNK